MKPLALFIVIARRAAPWRSRRAAPCLTPGSPRRQAAACDDGRAQGLFLSRHDPADSLADIVENAEQVERYIAGMDRQAFERNGLARDGVERCLERVCEAAHRLGKRAAELMPGQPWADIRGMGNRLRHAYDRVSLNVVWNAAHHDLPGLTADARRVLERLRAGRGDAG